MMHAYVSSDNINICILEFPRYKLIYDSKIHDMHKYVNFNLSGKCNKSDFAASQRGKEGRKERKKGRERQREIHSEKTRYYVP